MILIGFKGKFCYKRQLKQPDKEVQIAVKQNDRFGDYRLREQICSGGLATIWLATNKQGRSFALRILNDNFSLNSSGPRMFRRGCEVMAKLPPHPNVIRYISHGRKSGHDYMLLDYVEGANLRVLVIKDSPLLHEKISDMLVDMAEALAHVHRHDFMHLDFKPENLMISRSGVLMLCDFDTTLPIPDRPAKLSKRSGTPLYMSPEIAKGWEVDQRADIYSFAVTSYEMVTRVKPFEGQSPQEMLRNQLNPKYRIRKPRDLNPNIPVVLDALLMKCLSYLPDQRYPFMAHVLRDLHKALGVR